MFFGLLTNDVSNTVVNLHITAATVEGVLCCVTGSKRGVELSVNDKTFANEHGACAAAGDKVRCRLR